MFKPKPVDKMPIVIGIDLGTAYSKVACYQIGTGLEVAATSKGSSGNPSIIRFLRSGSCSTGESAARHIFDSGVFYNLKQLIGREFSDPFVSGYLKRLPGLVDEFLPFGVKASEDGKVVLFSELEKSRTESVNLEQTVEDIAIEILKDMKRIADERFQIKLKKTRAVLTVPWNFNEDQRRALKSIAEEAGLEVEMVVEEALAVTFAHGFLSGILHDAEKLIVIDLSVEALTISLITVEEGLYQCVWSEREDVGGQDFDYALYKWCLSQMVQKQVVWNPRLKFELLIACREAREILSTQEATWIRLQNNEDDYEFNKEITLRAFQRSCRQVFKNFEKALEKRFEDIRKRDPKINYIIPVGGGCFIPGIRSLISSLGAKKFGKVAIWMGMDGREAIAKGAALIGAKISVEKYVGKNSGLRGEANCRLLLSMNLRKKDLDLSLPVQRADQDRDRGVDLRQKGRKEGDPKEGCQVEIGNNKAGDESMNQVHIVPPLDGRTRCQRRNEVSDGRTDAQEFVPEDCSVQASDVGQGKPSVANDLGQKETVVAKDIVQGEHHLKAGIDEAGDGIDRAIYISALPEDSRDLLFRVQERYPKQFSDIVNCERTGGQHMDEVEFLPLKGEVVGFRVHFREYMIIPTEVWFHLKGPDELQAHNFACEVECTKDLQERFEPRDMVRAESKPGLYCIKFCVRERARRVGFRVAIRPGQGRKKHEEIILDSCKIFGVLEWDQSPDKKLSLL